MELQSSLIPQLIKLSEPLINYGISLSFENELNPYISLLQLIFSDSINLILNNFYIKCILKFLFDCGLLPILIFKLFNKLYIKVVIATPPLGPSLEIEPSAA